MLKEASEIVKALLEFFRSVKVVFTVFLCSAIWLLPPVRKLLPVPKPFIDNANFIAIIALLLSGVYLMVSVFVSLYQRVEKWMRSEERSLRKGLAQTSPLEKIVLEAVIHKGEYLIALDVGSPIAMHLQGVGLIEGSRRLGYTTYELATGLADLCIRKPSLLRTSERQQEAAVADLKQWRDEGLQEGFLNQLSEPSVNPWMDL